MSCKTFLSALLVLFALHVARTAGAQPTYQVSIYMSVHPRVPLVHICNGVILQRRLILTTASCVIIDYTLSANAGQTDAVSARTNTVAAERLRVVAGQLNVVDDTSAFPVAAIHVLNSFNPTTLADDLAVLRLRHPLPLGLRDDMKWIVVDDNQQKDNGCMASFHARNLMDAIPDSQQEEKVQPLPPQSCGIALPTHAQDYCAHYLLPQNFDCEQYEEYKRFNADRGTGLVCSSRLVALLSQTLSLPAAAEWHCAERPVPAMYVALAPHNDWIYQFIAAEEYYDVANNNYIPSLPYDESDPKVTSRPSSAGIASTPDVVDSTAITGTSSTASTAIATNANTNNNNSNDVTTTRPPLALLPTLSVGADGGSDAHSSSASTSFRYAHTTAASVTTLGCLLLLSVLQRLFNSSISGHAHMP